MIHGRWTMNPHPHNRKPARKRFWSLCLILGLLVMASPAQAADRFQYHLYTDVDHYGIVVFPKKYLFEDLDQLIKTMGFQDTESGGAVWRFGSVNRNGTYMMPESVQKKHNIEMFVILQILEDQASIMVGIWEQEFGLTLPSSVFQMEEVRKKLPQTLDIFRKKSGKTPKTPISDQGGRDPYPHNDPDFFREGF